MLSDIHISVRSVDNKRNAGKKEKRTLTEIVCIILSRLYNVF